jgi:hypothetical protein
MTTGAWFPPGWFPGGASGTVGASTGIGTLGTITAGQIINLALRRIASIDPDETIDTVEESNALTTLDFMLKELAGQGLATAIRDTLFLFIPDKTVQVVSNLGGLLTSSHNTTTTTVAAAAGAVSITVSSITNISSGDYILVKMANGHLHFTTVNGTPSGGVVVLTSVLAGAVLAGAYVYSYPSNQAVTTSLIAVESVARLTTSTDTVTADEGGYSTEIQLIGDIAYQALPNKLQQGLTNQVYVRNLPTYTEFYLWPIGDRTFDRLSIAVLYYFADLGDVSDTLYVPPMAINAIAWQLAAEISTEYDLPEVTQKKLWTIAGSKMTDILDIINQEQASVSFLSEPNRQQT